MTWSPRRLALTVVASMAVLLPVGLAWACVAVVSLTNDARSVQPGGTFNVTGREFAAMVPVNIHLDSPTGPVLATATPDSTMNSKFTIPVTLPANIANGEHFLVATQDHHDMNSGQPARSAFYVGVAPPPAPTSEARPVGLESESGPSLAVLVLIGLVVAVVGLALAGLWSVMSSRGGPGAGTAAPASTPAGGAS
ncbi:MAG: hypothetical protein ACRD12_12335 [Acidimicrobiales bacterium]